MRVLWLKTELLHPLDKGGRLRTYHTLRHLMRCHEVHYLALSDPADGTSAERAGEYCHTLETIPHAVPDRPSARFWTGALQNVFSVLPYSIARYHSTAMRERVRKLSATGAVDLVVSDFLTPSQNVPRGIGTPTLLFQHNVEAQIWQRHMHRASGWLSRRYPERQWRRMQRFEQQECARFDQVVAVSEQDAGIFRNDYGVRHVASVPTGVDTEGFRPATGGARTPGELLFTGSLDWLPNEDAVLYFAREILPRIRQREPGARFTIVGRRPSARIRQLAAADPAIRLAPDVPDVRPFLGSAAAFVVPLRIGGGTRLKIFEAMAMELPVVSTSIGAEGLPLEAGVHLEIADSPAEFAARVVRLLHEPAHAGALASRAATLVRGSYDWRAAGNAFIQLCEEVVERHRPAYRESA